MLRRITTSITALWLTATITFVVMHLIPGGPFASEKNLPESIQQNIELHYHLNAPLFEQYISYFSNLLHGDLGPSFKYEHRTVNQIIGNSFPVSATLGVLALCLSILVGIAAGTIAAIKHHGWPDYLVMLFVTMGISIPSFILSALLIYLFSYKLNVFLPALWGTWQQIILPTIALSALPSAVIARLTRFSLLEVIQSDYLRTAKAKRLPPWRIIFCHALRNALLPVIGYLGPLSATLLSGSFIIEHIFAIPGMGKWFVLSVLNRDYTLIMGLTLFFCTILMLINLLTDLLYQMLNPRIQLADKEVH